MTLQVAALQGLEQLTSSISAFTIDPYKKALYYFFPPVEAFFNGYFPLQADPSLQPMMPPADAKKMLQEISDLTDCAGIRRTVIAYSATALNDGFSNNGGSFSVGDPVLFIPLQHLFRPGKGDSPFGQEKPEEKLRDKLWVFSDDETRFLIARELGQISENSILVRVAIKIAVLATLFAIYASPYGWMLGLALCMGTVGFYIVSERMFQARADLVGCEILAKKIPNAREAALSALEKMRQQNLYRRENNRLARLYITESGNNVLDFIHPHLTTRIGRLNN
ncbi:MAG: hypothetical protein WCF19_02045 [Chlamydiales bacterium]